MAQKIIDFYGIADKIRENTKAEFIACEGDEWLEERRKYITGTDISALMGLNRYKTALDVYNSKFNGEEIEQTETMYWGNVQEDVIIQHGFIGLKKRKVDFFKPKGIFALGKFGVSLDGIVRFEGGTLALVECKNTGGVNNWAKKSDIPESYIGQMNWQMGITGIHTCYLCVLEDGRKYHEWIFEFDNDLWQGQIAAANKFHELYTGENSAPFSPAEWNLFVEPDVEKGTTVNISAEIEESAKEYFLNNKKIKELELKNGELKEIMLTAIHTAEKGIGSGFEIRHSRVAGKVSFDSKSFESDNPELYKRYIKTGASYQKFEVKSLKVF